MSPEQNKPEQNSEELHRLKVQMNRMRKSVFIIGMAVFAGFVSYFFIFSKPAPADHPVEYNKTSTTGFDPNKSPQQIGIPRVSPAADFAGEKVPYDTDFEVRERIDREIMGNTYSHSRTLLVMKRAGRWFPLIESVLKENGMPEDLKYVAVIESDLSNAISPAGATGFWQFMKGTAPEFGLMVNEEVDERYDVEKSTRAAAAYFKRAYAKFNSWTLAAASYNMGMAGVSGKLADQKQNSYYNLDLNSETSRYVARILAMKSIFENPSAYGFIISDADLYPQVKTKTISVSSPIPDLVAFAIENGTSYKMLKELNPWLRKPHLKSTYGKTFEIKIPDPAFNYSQAQKQIKGILPE